MAPLKRNYRELACLAARAASDKKAEPIEVFDIRAESDVADYMVILGADSTVQMRSVALQVEEMLEGHGLRPLHQEGRSGQRWIALDYGGLVIHVLMPEARDFYRLEQMWEKAKDVKWEKKKAKR